MICKPGIGRVE